MIYSCILTKSELESLTPIFFLENISKSPLLKLQFVKNGKWDEVPCFYNLQICEGAHFVRRSVSPILYPGQGARFSTSVGEPDFVPLSGSPILYPGQGARFWHLVREPDFDTWSGSPILTLGQGAWFWHLVREPDFDNISSRKIAAAFAAVKSHFWFVNHLKLTWGPRDLNPIHQHVLKHHTN